MSVFDIDGNLVLESIKTQTNTRCASINCLFILIGYCIAGGIGTYLGTSYLTCNETTYMLQNKNKQAQQIEVLTNGQPQITHALYNKTSKSNTTNEEQWWIEHTHNMWIEHTYNMYKNQHLKFEAQYQQLRQYEQNANTDAMFSQFDANWPCLWGETVISGTNKPPSDTAGNNWTGDDVKWGCGLSVLDNKECIVYSIGSADNWSFEEDKVSFRKWG
eukprot:194250_1